MVGCLLIAPLVYLSLPSKVGSPVATRAEASVPPGGRAAPSEAPQAAPQRLARAVLPLPIKRIVLDPATGAPKRVPWPTRARARRRSRSTWHSGSAGCSGRPVRGAADARGGRDHVARAARGVRQCPARGRLRVDPRQLDLASRRAPGRDLPRGPHRRSRRPQAGRGGESRVRLLARRVSAAARGSTSTSAGTNRARWRGRSMPSCFARSARSTQGSRTGA